MAAGALDRRTPRRSPILFAHSSSPPPPSLVSAPHHLFAANRTTTSSHQCAPIVRNDDEIISSVWFSRLMCDLCVWRQLFGLIDSLPSKRRFTFALSDLESVSSPAPCDNSSIHLFVCFIGHLLAELIRSISRGDPAELFWFLYWFLFGCSSRRRYSTRTLVSWRHLFIFFFSYRPGSALCGDVDASVVQQLAKHNSQKVTICLE